MEREFYLVKKRGQIWRVAEFVPGILGGGKFLLPGEEKSYKEGEFDEKIKLNLESVMGKKSC